MCPKKNFVEKNKAESQIKKTFIYYENIITKTPYSMFGNGPKFWKT